MTIDTGKIKLYLVPMGDTLQFPLHSHLPSGNYLHSPVNRPSNHISGAQCHVILLTIPKR